ncbi:MAG: DUF11 domain-containing protein [Sphingomonas sp.]|nr:DUF11 domain-containing protein [Sphingomonas sp.]
MAVAVLAAPQPAAATRTISNTAFLQWSAGSGTGQVASNRVDLDFQSGDVLSTYVPTAGTLPAGAAQASCAANGAAAGTGLPSPLAGVGLTPAPSVYVGRPVVLSLASPAANHDPAAIDTITVLVRTSNGDSETITFTESGPNSGTFLAVVGTQALPPAPAPGDCRLSVAGGSAVTITIMDPQGGSPMATASLAILVDPFGIAFDSRSGSPVAGVQVTLMNAATGQPAAVFGDDGVSTYPSTVITGQAVTDSGGTTYSFPPGDYRFPLVAPGTYRLAVQPVAPYGFPSVATPAQLSGLRRPDGQPFTISVGSFGQSFTVTTAGSVRTDVPLDRPATPLVIAKTVNRADAQRGDLLAYQVVVRNPGVGPTGPVLVTDNLPIQLRYRVSSAKVDGNRLADPAGGPDRALIFTLPPLGAGAQEILSYVLEVRPNAAAGDALNKAQARADGLDSNIADALVRIRDDEIAERLTVEGRVIGGGCGPAGEGRGVPGIRVMLEDGSYAVTDLDGRYHFDGVKTGTHVVQIDRATIPAGAVAIDCERDVRSGGQGNSRFVTGLGGELKRVDFRLAPAPGSTAAPIPETPAAVSAPVPPTSDSDSAAAGGDRDWLVGQSAGVDFLFPAMDANPRSPVTRVVVKHLPGQRLTLLVDGKPADPIAFDGTRKSADGTVAVSTWRGIPLTGRSTELRVDVRDPSGSLVKTLRRTVAFANMPANAELVRDRSLLLADGIHRPVLAFRITDRGGRPVHHGVSGEFELPDPYYPAMEADAQQARQLAGLERARPAWHVAGDDGIALVELEPTTASGSVSLRFSFHDGASVREERLEAWLSPGERPWTVVGLAEGSVGFSRLDKHLEQIGADTPKDLVDGRLALYAKGRVLGRWLMTLSYDSDKHKRDERFGGVIDPQQYYTVYADRSERRYDAASIRKLYIRLERPQFYALFGDYNTAIDEPVLTRYIRSLNGAKAEYRSPQVAALAFASKTPLAHQRDEIQGNGLSGPYPLRSRGLLANSERVTLQTRDRLRSEKILDEKLLARYVDYDIDYERGTLTFRSPVLSRSSGLDPQFIIVEYDVVTFGRTVLDAGARLSWQSQHKRVQLGATAIHDNDGSVKTDVAGADVKIRVTPSTELRAEAAISHSSGATAAKHNAHAWLVELEHHDGHFDALAYASEREAGFGTDQLSGAENGTRKIGLDARWHLNDRLALVASAWHHVMLEDGARRDAGQLLAEYRRSDVMARAGLTFAHDELADGSSNQSTLLTVGGSKRFARGKLEFGAESDIPLGRDGSVDFPARHRLTARFEATRWASLVASYEIAKGGSLDARTARLGFDLAPWAGAKIALSGNAQDIPEYGRRTFAAFGLAQSLILSKRWSVDLSLDSNRTIGGINPGTVINPLQPVASGGFVGDGSLITEDFTAVTAGATYRSGRLSLTGRGEYRHGDREDRTGLLFGALRQIGEGRALGGALDWFRAKGRDGAITSVANASLSWANRPANRPLSWLDKLELRRDSVTGATPGSTDPLGNPLTVTGDARSARLINALAINYSSSDNRYEMSLFWGARYVSDRFGQDDIEGFSNLVSADLRVSIGEKAELGAEVSVRHGIGARSLAYSFGPQVGFRPTADTWLLLGYNVVGYRDRDFAADRYTRSGLYADLRFKFDELSLESLGLGRRR